MDGSDKGSARTRLMRELGAGRPQHVVTYGTSLTEAGAWVGQLREALEQRYPGLVTVTNSGSSGMWSGWGVENLDARVIGLHPDAVFIEFAINDAYVPYKTSVEQARANLEQMIDRIGAADGTTEIILMTMNPPINEHLEIRPEIERYYQMYREVAAERGLLLIDHYPNWVKVLREDKGVFDQYVPDGIHPGPVGCERVITPGILAAIE